MAQRLIRRLCNNCKREYQPHPEILRGLGFTEEEMANNKFYESVGCDKCNGIGYKGRAAIHEALFFSKDIKRIILESGGDIDEDRIKDQAVKDGMLTLRASGRERIKEGITTVEEIIAITLDD